MKYLIPLFLCFSGGFPQIAEIARPPTKIFPQILRTLPHTGSEFTQGLFIHENKIFEGTGLYGKSGINIFDLQSGDRLGGVSLEKYFGEGIAFIQNRLVQLTWRGQKAFVYEFPTLKMLGSFSYQGEGWGLATDGKDFIMSNGSDTLYIRDTQFHIKSKVPITHEGKPLPRLNELEWVGDYIYANIFLTTLIAEIHLPTGKVHRLIQCQNLLEVERPASPNHVLNGIAFNPASQTFYLTGKNWNNIFEVLIPLPDP